MKNIYLCSFLLFMASVPVFSQAYEGTIDYDKKKQQAVMIDYPHSQEAVEYAIIRKIEKGGHKAKVEKGMFNRDKGFVVFTNAYVKDISETRMDYILKLERKSKKQKDESTLYLIMSKDGENAMATMDNEAIDKAKAFLNNMLPEIEEANLELQISAQDQSLAKAEKKCLSLSEEQVRLEKKIKDLQADLAKNMNQQVNQQQEIENQKVALEELKAKRKVTE